jgi:putative NADH-flavin reductase
MKILVLGGMVFLGRHVVESALARGHDVTIFTRSRHNPYLFSEVEKLRGDRDGDLRSLERRRWDAVVDTSGTRRTRHRSRRACDLREQPRLPGVLVDHLRVADRARRCFEQAGVADRCVVVPSNVLESLPAGDAYILKSARPCARTAGCS